MSERSERGVTIEKEKTQKKLKTALILLILLCAGLVFAGRTWKQKQAGEKETAVNVQDAFIGEIRVTTEGNGTIEPARRQTVSSEFTLEIAHVEAEDGDIVKKGDLIASVDTDSVKDQITMLEDEISQLDKTIQSLYKSGSSSLTSPVAGRVKRIFVEKGDVLSEAVIKNGGVMELSTDKKLKVEFTSDSSLTAGETVTVRFEDYQEEGTVVFAEGGRYVVTIPDNSAYKVDKKAEVLDENGLKTGEGVLLSNAPYLVDARYGICDGFNVSEGTWVENGSTLLYRTDYSYNTEYTDTLSLRKEKQEKLQKLNQLLEDPGIYAADDGIISEIKMADMQQVNEKSPVYSLIAMDAYWLKAQIDELDIAGVAQGQDVTIVFDAFDEEEYPGKVEKVSALGTNTGGVTTYTVTIAMDGAEKVKPGMSATASIVLEEKSGALLVPLDAVKSSDGETYVMVYSGNEQIKTPVTLGLVNNTVAEVTEGLKEGQQVVVESEQARGLFSEMMQRRGRDE